MSLKNQTRLVGEPSNTHVTIESEGRILRPWLAIPHAIVQEARITATEDGLTISAVDPANVAVVNTTLHADVLDDYALDGEPPLEYGVNLDRLTTHLRDARMGDRSSDPVRLTLSDTRVELEITREYTETTAERTQEFLATDPDGIRNAPGNDDIASGLEAHASIERQAFRDAVNAVDAASDHIDVNDDGGDLVVRGTSTDNDGDVSNASTTRFLDAALEGHDGDGSKYSLDYVKDFAKGLTTGKIDAVDVEYAEEWPMRLSFTREADDTEVYSGAYMLAPRIQDGGS